jgi:hypothetical protein
MLSGHLAPKSVELLYLNRWITYENKIAFQSILVVL